LFNCPPTLTLRLNITTPANILLKLVFVDLATFFFGVLSKVYFDDGGERGLLF